MTLTIVLVASVLLTALAGYAQASNRSVRDFRDQRDRRYAGDGAIKAAINWARSQPLSVIDAAATSGAPCMHLQTAELGLVTVSCHRQAGSSAPRVVFVACIQTSARLEGGGVACATGQDRIIGRAGVDVERAPSGPPNVATIRWWATDP